MMINTHNHKEKMQSNYQDYIDALEKERGKIQVFQRELPLCLQLVTQAIEACKEQLSGPSTDQCNVNVGQSECSDQTSSDAPVLEEFIPIKRASPHDSEIDQEQKFKKPKNDTKATSKKDEKIHGIEKNCKKSDWLRSAQLWNQTPDPPTKQVSPRKVAVVEVKRNGGGGAFHPFNKLEKSVDGSAVPPSTSTSSKAEETGGGKNVNKEEKDEQSQIRKGRRCWSPELHKRFVQSLQQLGGSHAATPKQIRELMNVDGLTNDEVKSHLQKYRLHTRRPTPSTQNNNTTTQTPQFVVVGGIWMSPEYTTITESKSRPSHGNKIYAPIATLASPFQSSSKQMQQQNTLNSDERCSSHSEGGVHSHSQSY